MNKFRTIVTIRCINKLQSRLNSEKKRWNLPLPDTLASWKPTVKDKVQPFWVTKPSWDLEFDNKKYMKTRDVNGNVEWEFSIDTAHLWSCILAELLRTLNHKITEYRDTLRKQHPNDSTILNIVEAIMAFYNGLFLFMVRYKRVVKALLAIPSLRSSFLPASE